MKEKKCFKCGQVKPVDQFYRHKAMADGRLNKCKDCAKKDTKENRSKRIDYYRAYDRKRGNRQTPEDVRRYRKRFPNKYRAHGMIARAIRSGKLVKEPCEVCGSEDRVHAHHDDYAKPLNIRWLCAAHHHQWHAENGEARNP